MIIGIAALLHHACSVKRHQERSQSKAVTCQRVPGGGYVLRVHNISLGVDPDAGGKVTSFKLGDKEQLTPSTVHPKYYGSTLWISPQNVWSKPWPRILDSSMYKASVKTPYLYLKSETDQVNGLKIVKRFYGDATDTSISILYRITNRSKEEKWLAPWEVTRVPVDGLSFFPKESEKPLSKSNLVIYDSIGVIWFPYDHATISKSQKMFMNGAGGWLAHVNDRVLFLKQYPQILPSEAAPGEEEIEIYANKEKTYIELEIQGAYRRLLPLQSVELEVKWYLRKLPDHISAETGNPGLISYVRTVLQ